jgi:predicted dehydrogenase
MNTTEPLRFGICGLGFMGRTYFRNLSDHPAAQVVAVCDKNEDARTGRWRATGNLAAGAAEHSDLSGIAQYARPEELLADPRVQAVAITLPTPLHAECTVEALAAGKHGICEKPMAPTLADCDRMIAAARQSGRTLMIGQCIRFWPQYEKIKALVDEGLIGAVRFAKLARLSSAPTYSDGNWLLNGAASGGALLDLHVHDVDFAQYLLGLPATITAVGCRGVSGQIDHSFATYSYADGRYALLEVSWAYHTPWPFEMAITVCGDLPVELALRHGRSPLRRPRGSAAHRVRKRGWLEARPGGWGWGDCEVGSRSRDGRSPLRGAREGGGSIAGENGGWFGRGNGLFRPVRSSRPPLRAAWRSHRAPALNSSCSSSAPSARTRPSRSAAIERRRRNFPQPENAFL